MTTEQFLEEFNMTPLTWEEVADEALDITDDEHLRRSAEAFINALQKFGAELDRIGFEVG